MSHITQRGDETTHWHRTCGATKRTVALTKTASYPLPDVQPPQCSCNCPEKRELMRRPCESDPEGFSYHPGPYRRKWTQGRRSIFSRKHSAPRIRRGSGWMHAMVKIGDSILMLNTSSLVSPGAFPTSTNADTCVQLNLYFPDANKVWKNVFDTGTTVVMPPPGPVLRRPLSTGSGSLRTPLFDRTAHQGSDTRR